MKLLSIADLIKLKKIFQNSPAFLNVSFILTKISESTFFKKYFGSILLGQCSDTSTSVKVSGHFFRSKIPVRVKLHCY